MAATRADTDAVHIMSYNVLAQCFVKSSWFPYCKSSALRWKTRSKLLKDKISGIHPRPDVLCLQECDQYDEFWLPTMQAMGYASLYLKKTGTKKDGVAIFYLENKLQVLGGENVALNEVVDTITDEDLKGRVIRDSVGLIAHFQLLHHPRNQFVVATTHLFWDPAQADVKLAQVEFFMHKINQFRQTMMELPVVFAGDFNSLPQSQVYESILANGFASAYCQEDGEPPFTNVNGVVDGKPAFIGTLDYIFYLNVQVTALLPLMDYTQATKDGGALPSQEEPSDHLPIMATFVFKN